MDIVMTVFANVADHSPGRRVLELNAESVSKVVVVERTFNVPVFGSQLDRKVTETKRAIRILPDTRSKKIPPEVILTMRSCFMVQCTQQASVFKPIRPVCTGCRAIQKAWSASVVIRHSNNCQGVTNSALDGWLNICPPGFFQDLLDRFNPLGESITFGRYALYGIPGILPQSRIYQGDE